MYSNYIGNFRRGNDREAQNYRGQHQHFGDRCRGSFRSSNFDSGRNRSRERQFQVTLGEMIEVAVGQDQDLGQVLIETELGISNIGNTTTLSKIVQ